MAREDKRNTRKLVIKPVKYSLIPSVIRNTFDALAIDLSDSGICLLTTSELKNHQRIIIRDNSCSSEKVAVVKWSEQYDDMFYKVGLKFIKDRTFLKVRDKRRYTRLNIENLNMNDINGKMPLANYIKIIDMSLDGLSFETDRILNIGEEYILHLGYEEKTASVKGYITWSTLKHSERTHKGDAGNIYKSGMKLTISPDEMREFINFVKLRLRQRSGEKQGYFSLSLDELHNHEKDGKYLKSSLCSL